MDSSSDTRRTLRKVWPIILFACSPYLLFSFGALVKSDLIPPLTRYMKMLNTNSYESLALSASVEEVISRGRGLPYVRLSNGRTLVLSIPGEGTKYLQADDSIVKQADTTAVTIYRRYPTYTEVRHYSYLPEHRDGLAGSYSCLRRHYRVPQLPTPPQ